MVKHISISLLTLSMVICLIFLANISHATDGSRWVVMVSSKTGQSYLDTETCKLYKENDELCVDCWIKVTASNESYTKHVLFRTTDYRYMTKECVWYDKEGRLIKSRDYSNKGWKNATPGSNIEMTLKNVYSWINENK